MIILIIVGLVYQLALFIILYLIFKRLDRIWNLVNILHLKDTTPSNEVDKLDKYKNLDGFFTQPP